MSIFTRTTPEPTLDERHNAANATASAALSVFDDILADLLYAADEHDAISAEAQTEIDRLIDLRTASQEARNAHRRAATELSKLTAVTL